MIFILLFFASLVPRGDGANILAMLPLPLYSHTRAYLPIMEELARRGHNVTVVSPYPRKEPLANYTDVSLPVTLNDIWGTALDPHELLSFYYKIMGIGIFCPTYLKYVLELPQLEAFINNDRTNFDLVITETFFCQEPFAALSHKYSAHLVAVHPLMLGSIEAHYTGNTVPYSYVPYKELGYTDHMSFTQRFLSSFIHTSQLLATKLLYESWQECFMRRYFNYPSANSLPPISDLLYNHSLILLDYHKLQSFPRPYLGNVVEFGGPTISKSQPLPKDLQDFMDNAKDGVIYFSWGSLYNTTHMKPETLAKFLSVFSKLKQQVIMKWEASDLPGKPSNVRIQSWLPQASILGHPNLVVFISHCGTHGLNEATYHGVPMLGTPLFADQFQNLKVAEQAGYAISLDIDSFTEGYLLESLNKLIYDPMYKNSALKRSAIIKDRPLPPLDSAVYWIEYVLRHNGARHLRPASLDIPWYQYFLLDIIGVLLLALLLLLIVLISVCKLLYSILKKQKVKKD